MKKSTQIIALLALAIVVPNQIALAGCGQYPNCTISAWTEPSCPDCNMTRTVNDAGCWGPALPQQNCISVQAATWIQMRCIGGVCRANTAIVMSYETAHIYGPDCKYGGN